MKSVCSMCVAAMLTIFAMVCSDGPEVEKMPVSKPNSNVPDETPTTEAVFAAGCFWGVEAAFRKIDGVTVTEVGYAGGHAANPTYREVCSGRTGHAEAVRVWFDPSRVSYEALLDMFWNCHDPTTLNRQGPDVGSQYRSAIFFYTPAQQTAAEDSAARLEQSGHVTRSIVTEIVPAGEFYRAEEYHQRYLEKCGRSSCGPTAK